MQKYKVFEVIVLIVISSGIILPGLADTQLEGVLKADTSDYLLGPGILLVLMSNFYLIFQKHIRSQIQGVLHFQRFCLH